MKKILYILVFLFSLFILNNVINAYTEYKIGDEVEYNGIKFYVIKDSDNKEDSVTMLKAEPLSYEEIQKYTEGIDVQITNRNGYGGMQYHLSSVEYSQSYVKLVVDTWKAEKVPDAIEARILTYDELTDNLGYEKVNKGTVLPSSNGNTPDFVINNNRYWTMTQYGDDVGYVWYVDGSGSFTSRRITDNYITVRPVITLSKTVLGDKDESVIEEDVKQIIPDKKEDIKQTSTKVKVENTYLSQSIIIIILGFIIGCASLTLYYIIRKKEGK